MPYQHSFVYYRFKNFHFSVVGIHLGGRKIDIDIKPMTTTRADIIDLLFTKKELPKGAKLEVKIIGGVQRVTYHFPKSTTRYGNDGLDELAKLRKIFITYHIHQHYFTLGWQGRLDHEREQLKIEKKVWETYKSTKIKDLGWRTPNDVEKLPSGPYEIIGHGFLWYGYYPRIRNFQIQTYPFSKSKNFNDAIRWFLQRGLSLFDSLSLNSKQMEALNNQALIAAITILLANSGGIKRSKPQLGVLNNTLGTAKSIDNFLKNLKNTPAQVLQYKLLHGTPEEKVQLLNKIVDPIKITKLRMLSQ